MKESKRYLFASLLFFSVFLLGASATRAILIDSSGNVIVNRSAVLSKQSEETTEVKKPVKINKGIDSVEVEEDEDIGSDSEVTEQESDVEETDFQLSIRSKKKVNILNKNGTTQMLFEEETETPEG